MARLLSTIVGCWLLLLGTASAQTPRDLMGVAPTGHAWQIVEEGPRWLIAVQTKGPEFKVRVQPSGETSSPQCVAHGMELEVVNAEAPLDASTQSWLDEVCARFRQNPPHLEQASWRDLIAASTPLVMEDDSLALLLPATSPFKVWPLQLTHLWVLLCVGLVLRRLPRRAEPWLFGALAFTLRLVLTEPSVLLSNHAYSNMLDATGTVGPHARYGPGWSAFMGLIWVFGLGPPTHVQSVNLVLSAVTVSMVWLVARDVAGEQAARWAASFAAVMPLAVALSQTESMFILVAMLQVTTMWLLLDETRPKPWAALACGTLLVLTRPGQVVFAATLVAILAARKSPAALLFALVLLARVYTFPLADEQGAMGTHHFIHLRQMFGVGGSVVWSDPLRTPLALIPLALWGTWVSTPRGRWLALAGVLSVLPYLQFHRWTDITRFSLGSLSFVALLAGIGAASLPRRGQLAAAGAFVVTLWLARAPLPPHVSWRVEYAALRSMQPDIREHALIRYDTTGDMDRSFARWNQAVSRVPWRPLSESTVDQATLWLGRVSAHPRRPEPCPAPTWLTSVRQVVDGQPLDGHDVLEVTYGLARCGEPHVVPSF